MVLTGVGAGDEMFAAIFYPAEGGFAGEGEVGDGDFLGLEQAFVAKAAADIGWGDANDGLGDAQHFGQADADEMRHLGGGVDDELAGAMIPPGDDALALHRVHGLTGARSARASTLTGAVCATESMPVSKVVRRKRLSPQCSWSNGALGARPASQETIGAVLRSRCRSVRLRSSAAARESAMASAMASPT